MRFFVCWGTAMRWIVLITIILVPFMACANIASTDHVANVTASKVDTAATANQTMAGTYTVSGTLIVPTQPLPTAN